MENLIEEVNDEVVRIEKSKRILSDKEREALARGRETNVVENPSKLE
jgi:hypothetical protein